MQPLPFIFIKSNAQLGKMGHLAWGIELYGQEELQLRIQGYASKGPCHVVQLKRYFLTADA